MTSTRNTAEHSSPSLSDVLALQPLEHSGIPLDCPAAKSSGRIDLSGQQPAGMKDASPDMTSLKSEGCYACPAISQCYPQELWQRCLVERGPRLMVDTLQLRFSVRLEDEQMAGWTFHDITKDEWTKHRCYKLYRLDNGSTLDLTYYNNYYGLGPSLFIRFSLPKVLHGSNLVLVPPLEQAVQWLAFILNSIPDLPELDPWKGIVSELHVCCNFPVGELAPYYISTLRNSQYPRRKTNGFLGTGVIYPSTLSTSEFYDKGIESKNPVAQGLLRQETPLRSKAIRKAIKGYTGKEKDPTLRDVTEGLMHYILKRDQEALRILDRTIGTADMARKILCDTYGPTRGMRLYGYLGACRDLGTKEQLAREIGSSPRSTQKALKQIADAGIALVLTDALVPLPPLTLPQPRG